MKKMRDSCKKDETGKIYGFLKVIREATQEERPRKDRTGLYWNCTCLKCGRKNIIVFGDYLRNGDTKSCGCINSINESKIAGLNEIPAIIREDNERINSEISLIENMQSSYGSDRKPADQ